MKSYQIYSLLLLTLISAVIYTACDSKAEEVRHVNKTPIRTGEVLTAAMSFPVHTSGLLAAKAEAKLSFKVGGIIERIYVDEGANIRKGQLLATLNLSEIRARVNQAQSAFENASRDLERIERLYADSVVTLEQKHDVETALDVARSKLEIAEFNMKHAQIYAPSTGKILKRFVESNELINAGTPVFTFGSTGRDWIVRVGVTDRDIVQLQLQDTAHIYFDAYPGQHFTAKITEMAEAVDMRSGTYEVELTMQQPGVKLISGFVARVDIFPSKHQVYALIPIEALMEGDGYTGFVFTPENNETVKKISVNIAHILEEGIAVSKGLENIREVVTEGAPYLSDGDPVKIIHAD